MSKVHDHLELLGKKVEDKVTGMTGVITCMSFDLFGCIQAVLTPPAEESGKLPDGKWMDVSRLNVKSKKPVMDVPDFLSGYVAEGLKGPADKPAF